MKTSTSFNQASTLAVSFLALLLFYSNCSQHQFSPVATVEQASTVIPLKAQQFKSADLKMDAKLLDIILVIDNSGSMQDDSRQLAARLGGFVNRLSATGFDWQMCWTTTDLSSAAVAGMPKPWKLNSASGPTQNNKVISKSLGALEQVFTDTVNDLKFGQEAVDSGQAGSKVGDERGIAALRNFVDRKAEHACLRPGATLTSIVISDEDERSVGGRLGLLGITLPDTSGFTIQDIDLPQSLLKAVNTAGIPRYIANSIILKSDDSACSFTQNVNPSTPAFTGTFYEALSQATNGGIGSICDSNYSTNLNIFYEKITAVFGTVPLACDIEPGSLEVAVDKPSDTYTYTLNSGNLEFSLMSTGNYHVEVSYRCR